jgi:hypothetical protein
MTRHAMLRGFLATCTAGVIGVMQAPVAGQQTPAPVRAVKRNAATAATRPALPRTPWGDPDLQGAWSTDDTIGVPIQRPDQFGDRLFLNEQEIANRAERDEQARLQSLEEFVPPAPGAGGQAVGPPGHWGERGSRTARQTSLVVDPPDGKIPALTPQAQRRAAGRDLGSFGNGPFNGPEDLTNYDRCISRGVLGSMMARPYGNGLEIVQAPGYVAIRHEMIHEARVIPLNAGPHVGSRIRQYMGDSRGRWEGDTLVVDTTNFTDQMSIGFNGNGLRHSDAMHLVERFTRVDAETIQYEVTIDDPKTYTRPWKIALPITTQPGYQVFEYACHEGNHGLPNILSAARTDEKAAEAARKQ